MTVRAHAATGLEAWERREATVLAVLPYVMLAITTTVDVFVQENGIALDLALSAAAALWMLWMVTLHPAWRERPRVMGVYFLGLIALMAALVAHAPWYGFFTFTGYLSAVMLPGRWRAVGVLAVAAVTGASQLGGFPDGSAESIALYVLIVAVNGGVAGALTWFNVVGDEMTRSRTIAIDELTEVNARLETTLEENA